METTTSTTQNAPAIITSCHSLNWFPQSFPPFAMHGYCTIRVVEHISEQNFDVYCESDGEEVLVGRNLSDHEAAISVNTANELRHNGWEV